MALRVVHTRTLLCLLFISQASQVIFLHPGVVSADLGFRERSVAEVTVDDADDVVVNRTCVQLYITPVASSCDNVHPMNYGQNSSLLRVALSSMLHACVQFQDNSGVRRLRVVAGSARLYPELQRLGSTFSRASGIPLYFNFSTRVGASSALIQAAITRTDPVADTDDMSGGADAFIVGPSYMPSIEQAGKLLDLSQLVGDDLQLNWFQIKKFMREQMVVYGNKVVAIPLTTSPVFLFYHEAIFLRDNLTVPLTWEGVLALAEKYNGEDLNGDGEPDYGVCTIPPNCFVDGYILQWVYASFVQTHGSSHGLFLDPETMANLANSTALQQALTVLRRLRLAGPRSGNCAAFEDMLFLQGRCLMSLSSTTTFKSAYLPSAPTAYAAMRGNMGVAPFPGSTRVLDRTTGQLVGCDESTCPLATHKAMDTDGVMRPVNQPTPSNNVVVIVNAKSPPKYQFYAYALFSYLASPEVLGATGAALLLDPRLETSPLRDQDLHPEAQALWVAAGYDAGDVAAFFAACRAAMDNPNQSFESKFPLNLNVTIALNAAAVMYTNASNPNPAPLAVAVGVVAQTVARVVAAQGGAAAFAPLYRQTLNWVPPAPPPAPPAAAKAAAASGTPGGLSHAAVVVTAVTVPCGVVVLLAVAVWAWWSRWGGRIRRTGVAAAPGAGPDTTLLVTDIQSSTSLWEHLDPEVMNGALSLHHDVMRRAIAAWSGYESATEGDSFIVAFRNPTDALGCALAAQQALLEAPWPQELLSYAPLPGLEGDDDPLLPVVALLPTRPQPGAATKTISSRAALGGFSRGSNSLLAMTRRVTSNLGTNPSAAKLFPPAAAALPPEATAGPLAWALSGTIASPPSNPALLGLGVAPPGAGAAAGNGPTSKQETTSASGDGGGRGAADRERSSLPSTAVTGAAGLGGRVSEVSDDGSSPFVSAVSPALQPIAAAAPAAARPQARRGSGGGGAAGAADKEAGGIDSYIDDGGGGTGGDRPSHEGSVGRQLRMQLVSPLVSEVDPQTIQQHQQHQQQRKPYYGKALPYERASTYSDSAHLAGVQETVEDGDDGGCGTVATDVEDVATGGLVSGLPGTERQQSRTAAALDRILPSEASQSLAATKPYRVTQGSGLSFVETFQTTMTLATSILAAFRILRGGAAIAQVGGGGGAAAAAAIAADGGAASPPPPPYPGRRRSSDVGMLARSSSTGPVGTASPLLPSPPPPAAATAGAAVLLFRGLRVRMGMWTGVPNDADVNRNATNKRMQYSGEVMLMAKAVSDSVHGGMVVMAECSRRRLDPDVVRTDRHYVMYGGLHMLSDLEGAPPLHLYTCYSQTLLPRAVVVRSMRTAAELRPGALAAPVGHGVVVEMRVAGISTLMAWNRSVAEASLEVLRTAALKLLPASTPTAAAAGTSAAAAMAYIVAGAASLAEPGAVAAAPGGTVGESTAGAPPPGVMVVVFGDADGAVAWAAALRRSVNVLDWPLELLDHELAEEVWAAAPTGVRLGGGRGPPLEARAVAPTVTAAAVAAAEAAAAGPNGPISSSILSAAAGWASNLLRVTPSGGSGSSPVGAAAAATAGGGGGGVPRRPRFRLGLDSPGGGPQRARSGVLHRSGGGGGGGPVSGSGASGSVDGGGGTGRGGIPSPRAPSRLDGSRPAPPSQFSEDCSIANPLYGRGAPPPPPSAAAQDGGTAAPPGAFDAERVPSGHGVTYAAAAAAAAAADSNTTGGETVCLELPTSAATEMTTTDANSTVSHHSSQTQRSRRALGGGGGTAGGGPTRTSSHASLDLPAATPVRVTDAPAAPGSAVPAAAAAKLHGQSFKSAAPPLRGPSTLSRRTSPGQNDAAAGNGPDAAAAAAAPNSKIPDLQQQPHPQLLLRRPNSEIASVESVAAAAVAGANLTPLGGCSSLISDEDRGSYGTTIGGGGGGGAVLSPPSGLSGVGPGAEALGGLLSMQLLFRGLRLRWGVASGPLKGSLVQGDVSGQVSYRGKAFSQASKLAGKAKAGQICATSELARTLPTFLYDEVTLVEKP